ncbi:MULTISPECIES: ABC transporter ATP-binding protein [Microbacterium]|uniref:ABC transporter ATP-binding protein n=1 Tax=Microbacterium TaxID=33882 RepID=UPI0011EA793D
MQLVVNQIRFRYARSGSPIVEDLTFAAKAGEITVLSGPSGCGKSTVLDLLGGLREVEAGRIELQTRDETLPPGHYGVSWVSQSNPVMGGRSARDNAAIPLLSLGHSMRSARASADEALHRVGLAHRASALVRELSGGEVQRVVIARCLVAPAAVLLADEPTGQLDGQNTRLVIDAIRAIAESGRVVILASHDPWVMNQCDQHLPLRTGASYE